MDEPTSDASDSQLSGLRVKLKATGRPVQSGAHGEVSIEDCAFCEAGHLTAPGSAKRLYYASQGLSPETRDRMMRCDRFVGNGYCGGYLAWVEDYGEPLAAAWALGGPVAAYEMVRVEWERSSDLEVV